MYKRSKVYPSGAPIPASLPDSYQPSAYGNAPAGQSCFTCRSFNMVTRRCDKWDAPVKPRWWCEGWTGNVIAIEPMRSTKPQPVPKPSLTKKITTSTVEEHFSEIPAGAITMSRNNLGNGFDEWYGNVETENEEDIIKVNVPLMIRLLEYARENAKGDVDLHLMVERMIDLGETGEALEMDDYAEIVPDEDTGTEQNGTVV